MEEMEAMEAMAEMEATEDAAAEDRAGLSDQDLAVLDIARRQWVGPGARERAIRERLGLSPTRYFQLLGALLDDPRALARDPVTVNRLRRVRDARRDQWQVHDA